MILVLMNLINEPHRSRDWDWHQMCHIYPDWHRLPSFIYFRWLWAISSFEEKNGNNFIFNLLTFQEVNKLNCFTLTKKWHPSIDFSITNEIGAFQKAINLRILFLEAKFTCLAKSVLKWTVWWWSVVIEFCICIHFCVLLTFGPEKTSWERKIKPFH